MVIIVTVKTAEKVWSWCHSTHYTKLRNDGTQKRPYFLLKEEKGSRVLASAWEENG